MTQQKEAAYPRIGGAYGRLSDDGKALLVDASIDEREAIRFAIAFEDVQHLVSYLLVWTARLQSEKSPLAAG